MKIAIVGSRDFKNIDKIKDYIQNLPKDTIVVSGAARGVDRVAAKYARENNLEVIEYPADWDNLGKSAGHLRNITIVENSDKIVAFWDGISKGTKHTIDLAKQYKKEYEIHGESDW